MPYKTGVWGIQAKERGFRKRKYYRERARRIYGYKNFLSFSGEQEVSKALNIDKLPKNSGADFKYEGKLIDVKTAIFRQKWGHWQFQLREQKGKIDYFLCLAKDKDFKTIYIFLVPDKEIYRKN